MASNLSLPGQIDWAQGAFTESRLIADITEINIPFGEEVLDHLLVQTQRVLHHVPEHFEGPSTGGGDVGVAGCRGVTVHLDLQHLGVLHQLKYAMPMACIASSRSEPSMARDNSLTIRCRLGRRSR